VENAGLGSPSNPGRLRYVAPSRPFLVSTGNPPGGTPRLYGRRGRLPLLERSGTRACRKSAVETPTRAANICLMKLFYAFAAWIAMGTVLGAGILMAVKGNPWLLIAGLIGFVIAVGKIGCLPH